MIRNMRDLERMLNRVVVQALEMTRDEIFEIVTENVKEYYNSAAFNGRSTPNSYQRTGKLLEYLTAGRINSEDGKYSFMVGWDDDYLEFRYPGWHIQYGRGLAGKNQATGEDVLNYMNSGRHGGNAFTDSHNYWDEALREIESRGNVDGIFKKYMIRLGVPIK